MRFLNNFLASSLPTHIEMAQSLITGFHHSYLSDLIGLAVAAFID